MRFTPRDYQRTAMQFLHATPRAALWAQPGLGKTPVTATVIARLHRDGDLRRALVLVPKRVLDVDGWGREFRKWAHLTGLQVVNITGTPAQREAVIRQGATVQVINYELVPWLMDTYYDAWPWDTLVFDESTKLKSHAGTWFKGKPRRLDDDGNLVSPAKPGLKHAVRKAKRVWCLTGTPSPNHVGDLWSQTYLLDQGQRLGQNITQFRNRYMRQGRDGFSWEPQPGADLRVAAQLQDICLTIKSADHLDLPDLVQTVIPVPLPADALRDYRKLSREFFLHLEAHTVEAVNAAVLSGKLMQYANGFLYTDGNTQWEEVHDAKIRALADFMEETAEPVVVCYKYQADLASLRKRFPDAVAFDGKPATVERFGRREIPMLLLHPGSAGHGIDGLQDGSNVLVWYGLTWSLEEHDQVIERIGPVRQLQSGHPRPVFIHYLAAQHTIDELVLERLIEKKSVQEILLNAMRKGHA